MSQNLEIEAKSMLDESNYLKLIKGNEKNCYIQINYYIDTMNFDAHEKKLGLRIRLKDGKYELTLKIRQKEGKLEINQDISKIDYLTFKESNVFPNGEVKEVLKKQKINIDELHIFTELKTTRLDVKYKTSLISIDKSEFSGIVDYEIECEDNSIEVAKANLIEYLNKNEVPYNENFVSKLRRARDSL
jgi:uncharacterized protein YjbK